MGVYDDDIATAKELIDEFGELCQWLGVPPVTGGTPGYPEVGETPDPINCKIAWFSNRDLGRGTVEWLQKMMGTEVPESGEIGLLAGGLTFEPSDLDSIRRSNGATVSIKNIDRLAPNGEPVLYYVTVRA